MKMMLLVAILCFAWDESRPIKGKHAKIADAVVTAVMVLIVVYQFGYAVGQAIAYL